MLSQYFWLVVFLSSFLDETKSSQKLNVPNISSRHEPEKRREKKNNKNKITFLQVTCPTTLDVSELENFCIYLFP